MEFQLSEKQQEMQRVFEKFAQSELAPLAGELDRDAKLLPKETWSKMGELGYLGLPFPKEYGGGGLSALDTLLCMEAAAKGGTDAGTLLSWGAHMIFASIPIIMFGTEEQKKKYLPRMVTGELIGAFALTEPNAGSDEEGIKTTAKRDGDFYILNGTKALITNGPICDVAVVFAVTDKEKGSAGVSAFIVERNFTGFSVGKKLDKMGVRSSPTSELVFNNCKVPAENLLGVAGEGVQKVARSALCWKRAILGYSVGTMEYNLGLCLEQARQRVQFGKSIGEFQAVQDKIADMKTEMEISRLLSYQAAWLIDQGKMDLMFISIGKLFMSKALMRNTNEAVQIFGGYGFMKEYPVERAFRDAKICQIIGGTSEIQHSIIASHLLEDA